MFDKNYKNAMDKVSPDEQTYDKILEKLILKEEIKSRKNPAVPWRVAFACVACAAIVLGAIFVPRDKFDTIGKNNSSTIKALKVSKSYDEIYKLIKRKKVVVYNFMATDDEEMVTQEELVTEGDYNGTNDGGAKPGASKGENTSANLNDSNGEKHEYSNTTEQVEGVTESDIVKTDGEYIYYVNDTTLSIFKADGAKTDIVSKTTLSYAEDYDLYGEMFLKDDRLVLLKTNFYAPVATNALVDYNYNDYKQRVLIEIYDISDASSPKKISESCQDGIYNTSRMVGDYIYLISNCHINAANIDKDSPATFVPTTETNGVCKPVPADSIYHYEQEQYNNQYTVISAFNYKDGKLSDTASLLGGTDNVYCSKGNIILADTSYSQKKEEKTDDFTVISQDITTVSRLAIKNGEIEYKTSGEVVGMLNNQFFIDEHNGYFRFVTTVTKSVEKIQKFENSANEVVSYSDETFAHLTVLDSELKKIGEITDLARGERVYSVRFMGDIAYFVTFRQTDPLFSADLSDPENPKILGELKIPGFSEYMYPYGDGLLLGFGMDADENTGRTRDLKLSMFNINDPVNVTEQNKTVIDGYGYSSALDNHKAMLVSPQKNLIGFAATDDFSHIKYMIYKYTDTGFEMQAAFDLESDYKYAMGDIRGLFVNDSFYVLSKKELRVFDMNTYLQIALVK